MTQVVVDANVVIKWLVVENLSTEAHIVLDSGEEFHAPRLMAAEVANVLRKKTQEGEITAANAAELAESMDRVPIHWANDEQYLTEALRLALELNHAAYDCMYLALAERLGTRLVTADMRFVSRAARTPYADAVVGLVDYANESRR